MGFDQPGHHIQPGLALMVGGDQHFPGFADARRRAEENLQLPAGFPMQVGEQRIGVGANIAVHRA